MTSKLDRPNTLSGLIEKRKELSTLLNIYDVEMRKVRCDLDHLEAAIKLFDGTGSTSRLNRHKTVHRARKGEVVRFVLNALRSATSPLTSLDITEAWLKKRALNADDGTMVLIRKRIGACLNTLKGKGVIRPVPLAGEYKGWEMNPDFDRTSLPAPKRLNANTARL